MSRSVAASKALGHSLTGGEWPVGLCLGKPKKLVRSPSALDPQFANPGTDLIEGIS
jgi:hypothetical protein